RSGVKIVIDHIGSPDPVEGVRGEGFKAMVRSVKKGRTWVKLSGAYRLGDNARECAQALCAEVDHDRLFWASDCPFVGEEARMQYAETVEWLVQTIPDGALRRQVFGENALRFYFS